MISVTPYLNIDTLNSADKDRLLEKSTRIRELDAALSNSLPPTLRHAVEDTLFTVNSYYSNLIEGNATLLADLFKPETNSTSNTSSDDSPSQDLDQSARLDYLELMQHIEVQAKTVALHTPADKLCSTSSITALHYDFFNGLPPEKLVCTFANENSTETVLLTPGQYRSHQVIVGKHVPIDPSRIKSHMDWFEQVFTISRISYIRQLIAAAGAHHRLAWIHPFLDGNGRVVRMFTDQYMRAIGLQGYGLWSMSRGFARHAAEYKAFLAKADLPRKGDTDGRGILSDSGLLQFTEFFLDTAIDQLEFFKSIFQPQTLRKRIRQYFLMRDNQDEIADVGPMPKLRAEAGRVYQVLVDEGPLMQKELREWSGLSESIFKECIAGLRRDKLILAEHKQPVKALIPPHAIPVFFPKMMV